MAARALGWLEVGGGAAIGAAAAATWRRERACVLLLFTLTAPHPAFFPPPSHLERKTEEEKPEGGGVESTFCVGGALEGTVPWAGGASLRGGDIAVAGRYLALIWVPATPLLNDFGGVTQVGVPTCLKALRTEILAGPVGELFVVRLSPPPEGKDLVLCVEDGVSGLG